MKNKGPTVQLDVSCFDCEHCVTKRYTCQGDSGSEVYCGVMDNRHVGDTCWRTPNWCPYRDEAVRAAIAFALPPADAEGV